MADARQKHQAQQHILVNPFADGEHGNDESDKGDENLHMAVKLYAVHAVGHRAGDGSSARLGRASAAAMRPSHLAEPVNSQTSQVSPIRCTQ